ncbi:MAG: hypothetical protein UHN59_07190, partial [Bacteroidales bacterium]|nr:hypothetical protein [Bacteroidales bacterium]
ELIDINRKRFKHLSDDLQMKILDFQIDIAMLEDAPTEIESLFFKRSNSGRGMTQIDMARSSNTAIETIKEIGKHEIFTFMFSKQMLDRFAQDEIVVKTWQALYEENPDYSLSRFKQVMKELDLTEQHIKQINNAYDMVLDAYKYVCIRSVPIGKAVLRKTHMFCYLPYLKRFSDSKHLSQWMLKFFANMPNEYVQASKDHTTSLKNTQIRNQIVVQSIDDFLKKEAP